MSVSESEYWKNYNKMLRDDKLEFESPHKKDRIAVRRITFQNSNKLLEKGVQFALNNFDSVASSEYENNLAQPKNITLKHLEWAKVFIDSKSAVNQLKSKSLSTDEINKLCELNALRHISFGEFLLSCHFKVQQNPISFSIYTDSCRIGIIEKMFGGQYERVDVPVNDVGKLLLHESIVCTQIIFDSSDLASAIDALLINLTDRTTAPWRIQSVYVQESLKAAGIETLIADRLNGVNDVDSKLSVNENERLEHEQITKRFGGKLLKSDNDSIILLFDVPFKHVHKPDANAPKLLYVPVAVNYFRTTKEVIQLVNEENGDFKKRLASIWTENIGLLYELVAGLKNDIFWSNSIGSFDVAMPSLKKNMDVPTTPCDATT